jgi:hypothetical protein
MTDFPPLGGYLYYVWTEEKVQKIAHISMIFFVATADFIVRPKLPKPPGIALELQELKLPISAHYSAAETADISTLLRC